MLLACADAARDVAPVPWDFDFTSTSDYSVPENTLVVGTATTENVLGPVVYRLTGGADQLHFNLDANSGVLNFRVAPNYELPEDSDKNNIYLLEITAIDGPGSVTQTVKVQVFDISDEPPVFTSHAEANVTENNLAANYVAIAIDPEGNSVSYSLTGGADQASFDIDASSGVLSFRVAPDFELPTDGDIDNTYVVQISATNGVNSSSQTITIAVTNSNDNTPVFTNNSESSVLENTAVTNYNAIAIDADGDTVSYRLTGGPDQAYFNISANAGELSFKSVTDFEMPLDTDTNNTYVVEVSASDGVNVMAQTVTITITDVLELSVNNIDTKTLQFSWSGFSNASYYQLLVNHDGLSGFSLIQDNIFTTSVDITIPVHLTDWVNASYILDAYDGTGLLTSSNPVDVNSLMLSTIGYFKASNAGEGDFFGQTVALSSDGLTMAVGAPGENSATNIINDNQEDNANTALNAGAVYVYTRSGAGWVQQAYIKASNAQADDRFGISVALSGDGSTLVVGADWEDSVAPAVDSQLDNSVTNAGAVYVFTRSGANWNQQAYIKASNPSKGDYFGGSLALSEDGSTLAVGAYLEDSSSNGINGSQADDFVLGSNSGAVYVFRRSGTSWSQEAYVKASNTNLSDEFGFSVSLSDDGSTMAVGAVWEASAGTNVNPLQSDNSLPFAGAVYVFNRLATVWRQSAYIKPFKFRDVTWFGYSVALSGDGADLAVGSRGDLGISGVHIYHWTGLDWIPKVKIVATVSDMFGQFGNSIAFSNNGAILAIGDFREDGSVKGVNGNALETSISTSDSGAAYIFERSGDAWVQKSYIKAPNAEKDDLFGTTVSLNFDGSILAVGAFGEDSIGQGINSDKKTDNTATDSGAVYLY